MYPIVFSIGKIHVYTHGLMIIIGSILGGVLIFYLARKENYSPRYLFDNLVISLLGGIIGARIAYLILYFNQFSGWKDFLIISRGGLVSFGGIIGGFLTAGILLKIQRESILKWFDLGIIGLLLGWSFGRIGCLLSGDSLGILSVSKIAIWGRIPTQLFEGILSLILAGILTLAFIRKYNFRFKPGMLFFSGLGMYSLGRFIIDLWRDESKIIWFLKAGQLSSLIVVIVSVLFVLYLKRNIYKEEI